MKRPSSKDLNSAVGLEGRASQALVELGQWLKGRNYNFAAVTPETHRHVLARRTPALDSERQSLREFFGWNRSLAAEKLPADVLHLLGAAAGLATGDRTGEVRSLFRAATVGTQFFWHSSFPTSEKDAVFLGPDSFRFTRFLRAHTWSAERVVDLGCGAGVGALSLSSCVKEIELADINDKALELARINAMINGVPTVKLTHSNVLDNIEPGADLLIANPPFMMDPEGRDYRHGGNHYGSDLALKIVQESLDYLEPGGRLLLYTGTCVVNGEDVFHKQLHELFTAPEIAKHFSFYYDELDPDIFGEELATAPYHDVDRIAAVGLSLRALLR